MFFVCFFVLYHLYTIYSVSHSTEEKTEEFETVNACSITDASTKGELPEGTIAYGHFIGDSVTMHENALSFIQKYLNLRYLLSNKLHFLWTQYQNMKNWFLWCRNVRIGSNY